MHASIQYQFKQFQERTGLLYAWFSGMHTRIDIILWGMFQEKDLLNTVHNIHDQIQKLEQVANYFHPESEISYVNRIAYFRPVPISPILYDLIQKSIEYHAKTYGYFDITVSSSHHEYISKLPILLLPNQQTVRFEKEDTELNFSGLLKGYALDIVRPLIEKEQIPHALINLGNSSILAIGNQPNGDGWKITFQKNQDKEICLHNECLTTSGNDTYERKHIMNPFTHEFVTNKKQIAVITPDGTSGEILSTSLFIADVNTRNRIIQRFPCLVID